ncbi:MAG: molybdopterin-guanine dinucleotide biosynthesis protein B [Proteobacteria bacterium]|nr:molybdopterin-guanine dinucleotide biosynthesis protein B [Pseudomonadota bacterium]
MANRGLQEAIRAVGGVTELARRIGISQPSVSNWTRVPAGRVAAVEAATGVDRSILRPDLYGATDDAVPVRARDLAALDEAATSSMRIVGLAGWSGSGKTTLITRLIPVLKARGLNVSTLKHAHHGFDLDRPGKDSFRHREAGATEVIVSSANRWAILHELRDEDEWDLLDLVAKMSPVDLVLVEGFKRDAFPKIEIHRAANGKPLIHPDDPYIIAVAADVALPDVSVPIVDLNDIDAIADLVLAHAASLRDVARAMAG